MVRRSRFTQFTNEQWERVDPLLPSNEGRKGRPFEDNRRVVEGIVYRYRTGIPWRDLQSGSVRGRQCGSGTVDTPSMAPGIAC